MTCLLLSGQGGSGKGQGGQEVTSPPDEVSSLYIRNSFKTAISFMSSHIPEKIFKLLCPFLFLMKDEENIVVLTTYNCLHIF